MIYFFVPFQTDASTARSCRTAAVLELAKQGKYESVCNVKRGVFLLLSRPTVTDWLCAIDVKAILFVSAACLILAECLGAAAAANAGLSFPAALQRGRVAGMTGHGRVAVN